MGVYLAQVVLTHSGGLPSDHMVNTFHFEVDEPSVATELPLLETAIIDFYNASISSATLAQYLSPRLSRSAGANTIKWYRFQDLKPRAPYRTTTWTLGTTSDTTSLPQEVALCLSYKGAQVSGLSMRHRRGRIYVGAFGVSANNTSGSESTPATALTARMRAGASALLAASITASAPWVVYSPTLDSYTQIVGGWTDNAWDTQRRRGTTATLRNTWT